MIYRKKTHFVEINNFLQRLHEPETEDWVPHFSPISGEVGIIFFMKHVAINFHVLSRPRNIALSWPDPLSDHAVTQLVRDKLILFSIPCEQRWTLAASAVHLKKTVLVVANDFDFILQHAQRPEHTHNIGLFGLSETDGEIMQVLAAVS